MAAYFVVELTSDYVPNYPGEIVEHHLPSSIAIPEHVSTIQVVNALNLTTDIMNFIVATTDLDEHASTISLIEYNATIDVHQDVLVADIPAYSTEVFIEPYSTIMES